MPEGEVVWVDGEAPPPRLRGPILPPPASSSPSAAIPSPSGTAPAPSLFFYSKDGNVRARVVCARSGAGGVQVSAVAEARRKKKKKKATPAAAATAAIGATGSSGSEEEEEDRSEEAPFSDEEIAEAVAAALDAAGAALRDLEAAGAGGAEEEGKNGESNNNGGGGGGGGGPTSCPFSRATHVRLYIPTMAAFSAANARYGERMPRSSPPARACVACDLGRGGWGEGEEEGEGGGGEVGEVFAAAAVVDVLGLPPPPPPPLLLLPPSSSSSSMSRSALHVQSISPWAPACIGPYAQAVAVGGRLLRLAGQIGLDPWRMELVSSAAAGSGEGGNGEGEEEALSSAAASRLEAPRALRSCQAVAVACRADLRRGGMASCAVFASVEAGQRGLEEAGRALGAFLNDDDDDDDDDEGDDEEENEEGKENESLFVDEYLRRVPPPASRRTSSPLLTYYLVEGLPRGAAVEFEPLAWIGGGDSSHGGSGGGLSSWRSVSATSRCDALVSPGRLCMARAVAKSSRGGGEEEGKGRGKGKGLLEGAFEEALEGIAAALEEAAASGRGKRGREEREQLPSLALVSARAFFRSSVGSATIASASAALARAWEEKGFGAATGAPVAVPVAALGAAPEALDADVAVEVHFERVGGGGGGEGCWSSSSSSDSD